MNNIVPSGWEAASFGDLCKFSGGSAFKEKYQGQGRGYYPFIKVSDMNIEGNQRFITKANHWIDQDTRLEAKVKLFPKPAVVFAKVGAALLLNRRRILTRETAIDNNMMAAIPFDDGHNFLYYALQEVDLGGIVQGGAVPSVNQAQMEDIPVLIPPLSEQQKIATILSSVDDVIEKIRAQIDKLKDLKTGMMQELLTKGIGHTEFKSSPVGRIPAAWEIARLGDIVLPKGIQTGPFGSQLHSHEYIEWGVPVIMPRDMKGNKIDPASVAHIPLEKAAELDKHRVEIGDLVFARRGDIGRFALVDKSNEGWVCGTGCLKVRLKPSVSPSFIASYLTLTPVIEWLNTNAVGQTMLNLNTSILSELPIILPPAHEQAVIGEAILSLDNKVALSSDKLDSLLRVKKALMQDLLTGKVRVNQNDSVAI